PPSIRKSATRTETNSKAALAKGDCRRLPGRVTARSFPPESDILVVFHTAWAPAPEIKVYAPRTSSRAIGSVGPFAPFFAPDWGARQGDGELMISIGRWWSRTAPSPACSL